MAKALYSWNFNSNRSHVVPNQTKHHNRSLEQNFVPWLQK
jgi:hypothetical protein